MAKKRRRISARIKKKRSVKSEPVSPSDIYEQARWRKEKREYWRQRFARLAMS